MILRQHIMLIQDNDMNKISNSRVATITLLLVYVIHTNALINSPHERGGWRQHFYWSNTLRPTRSALTTCGRVPSKHKHGTMTTTTSVLYSRSITNRHDNADNESALKQKTKSKRRKPPSNKTALRWVIESIERSDTELVQLATLSALRDILNAKTTKDVIDAGKKLEQLNISQTEGVSVRERVLRICATSGLMPLAHQLLQDLLDEGHLPPPIAYMPLIVSYRKMRKVRKMEECLQMIVEACRRRSSAVKQTLDVVALNCYLGALVDSKRFEEAVNLLQQGVSFGLFDVKPDLISFNTVLSAAVRCRQFKVVDDVSSILKCEADLKGDIYTLNAQLRSANLSNRDDEALDIIENVMENSNKIKPDRYFVDNALTPLVNSGRIGDASRLVQQLEAKDGKVMADAFSAFFNTLVEKGHADFARSLFDKFVVTDNRVARKTIPTTRHFNTLLEGYRREEKSKEAVELMKIMLCNNVKPDSYTLTIIMATLNSSQEMRKLWRIATKRYDIRVTIPVITSYITELGRVGDVSTACRAFEIVRIKERNAMPLPLWNSLLKVLSRKENNMETIIMHDGVSTNVIESEFSSIINGVSPADASRRILNFMKQNSGCPKPDCQSFCLVASATSHSCDRSAAIALELFYDTIDAGVSADGRLVNAIMRCFGSDISSAIAAWKGEIGKASRSHRDRLRDQYKQDLDVSAAYHGLMTVCGRAGRPDIAVRLTYAMAKEGAEPTETALQCYAAGKREAQPDFSQVAFARQFESVLTVECTKYVKTDRRRSSDKKIRIIL